MKTAQQIIVSFFDYAREAAFLTLPDLREHLFIAFLDFNIAN